MEILSNSGPAVTAWKTGWGVVAVSTGLFAISVAGSLLLPAAGGGPLKGGRAGKLAKILLLPDGGDP
jgi:hypothetical protein